MANERLTAEEFREQIMELYANEHDLSQFATKALNVCVREQERASELAALDFDDCEGGACKL